MNEEVEGEEGERTMGPVAYTGLAPPTVRAPPAERVRPIIPTQYSARRHLRAAAMFMVFAILTLAVIYPVVMVEVGMLINPHGAGGSLEYYPNGTLNGSSLVPPGYNNNTTTVGVPPGPPHPIAPVSTETRGASAPTAPRSSETLVYLSPHTTPMPRATARVVPPVRGPTDRRD